MMENGTISNQSIECPENVLKDLEDRAQHLLRELQLFELALHKHGKAQEAEFRVFRRGIQSELKSLRKLRDRTVNQSTSDDEDNHVQTQSNYVHGLKSSNISFYEAVWQTAKTCQHITGLGRRVYYSSAENQTGGRSQRQRNDKQSVVVDVIADNGLKWIKVSTVNNKRILFEIAKQGWERYGDYSSGEEDVHDRDQPLDRHEDADDQIELIKLARALTTAAETHRIHFKHPKVHFVLPNVLEGEHDDVDALLRDLRATNVVVSGSPTLHVSTDISHVGTLLSDDKIVALLPTMVTSQLTTTLNVDCTIALALISDISHVSQSNLPPYPTNRSGSYHRAILQQIENDKDTPLLPNELYRIISGRKLLCTSHAAERMFKIANTMGTDQERERAAIFFGLDEHAHISSDNLRSNLAKTSCHTVPDNLYLPIKIVQFDDLSSTINQDQTSQNPDISGSPVDIEKTMSLPDEIVAQKLIQKIQLSKINTSVFLYGWSRDITTITSNKVVATNINKTIDEILDEIEFGSRLASNTTTASATDAKSAEHTSVQLSQDHGAGVSAIELDKFVGPKIYICETARSLIGKEKQVGD